MYFNDYEDYSMEGVDYSDDYLYQRSNENYYNPNCSQCYFNQLDYSNYQVSQPNTYQYRNDSASSNIEQMYPEIYKIINPMVCKMCDNNRQPITEYLLEQMTDDIYDNVVNRVEIQNVINLNIGTRSTDDAKNENKEDKMDSRSVSKNSQNRGTVQEKVQQTTQEENRETRSPQYQPRRGNRLLRDLIRILLLNRLIRPGRPHRPGRPPFRPNHRPGMEMPRPHYRAAILGYPEVRPYTQEKENNYNYSDYLPY